MIVVKAGGLEFKFWTDINIQLNLDTAGSPFTLTGLMDEKSEFLFEPFSFVECEVWIIDDEKGINEVLITGYLVNPGMSSQKKPRVATISGFSRPGILQGATMPQSLYPLQWTNTNLRTICQKVASAFNLTLKIHDGAAADAEIPYEEIKCGSTEDVKGFLSRIAKDRGITIAHDNLGRLFVYKIVNTIPATSRITEDDYHISMSTSPNGQGVHSECTAMSEDDVTPAIEGDDAEVAGNNKVTVKSPFQKNIFFPTVTKMKEGETKSLTQLAEAKLAREARSFPIKGKKEGWDFAGRIVRAGFFLEVEAPSILVEDTKFVVESMTFSKKGKGPEMLSFSCILPCVYTGKLPVKSPFKNF